MPTVIDELIILLKLDPKQFDEGQKSAVNQLRKFEDDTKKHVGGAQTQFGKLGNELVSVQNRLLGIAALFLGGLGIAKFTEQVATLTNNLSRMGAQIGVSAKDLSAWGAVGGMFGANPEAVRGAVAGFSGAVYGNKLIPNSALRQSLAAMGVGIRQTPDGQFDINGMLLDLSKWATQPGRSAADATAMLKLVPGMNADMITLLLQGPEKLKAKLAEMAKLGPTPGQVDAVNRLTEAWGKMTAAAERMGRVFIEQLEPAIQAVIKAVEWFFNKSSQSPDETLRLYNENQKNAKTGLERWRDWREGRTDFWGNPLPPPLSGGGIGSDHARSPAGGGSGVPAAPATPPGSSPSAPAPSGGATGAPSGGSSSGGVSGSPSSGQTALNGRVIPQAILDRAREVAASGGIDAVQGFMASQGYPMHRAWCGDFAAAVVRSVGGTPPKDAQVASNWRNWGEAVDVPQPGDIAVRRGARTGNIGSHVTIVQGYDAKSGTFRGIGGNQGRWESTFPASRYEFRRAPAGGRVGAASYGEVAPGRIGAAATAPVSNNSTRSTNIGAVNVTTPAGDPHGVATGVWDALMDTSDVAQSTTGLD